MVYIIEKKERKDDFQNLYYEFDRFSNATKSFRRINSWPLKRKRKKKYMIYIRSRTSEGITLLFDFVMRRGHNTSYI